jgi:hypothetical protein
MKLVILPSALIAAAIRPLIFAMPIDIVEEPSSSVRTSITPKISPQSVFLPLTKLSLIVSTVFPFLFSVAIFQVIDPGAHIFRPVFVIINALTIGSVV